MESWAVHMLMRVLVGAVMAPAHAALVRTEPPRWAVPAPAQVRFWFNEEIESA